MQHRRDLQRFREVSAELKTWSDYFTSRHGRRPTRGDVVATRIAWLEEHFEEYFALRQRLVSGGWQPNPSEEMSASTREMRIPSEARR